MGALPGPLPTLTGATRGPALGWCRAAEEGGERAIAVSGHPANLLREIYRLFVQSSTSTGWGAQSGGAGGSCL